MRKSRFLVLLVLSVFLMSCYEQVDPGFVGVRTHQRGTRAGEVEVLPVGRHDWVFAITTTTYPTFKQNYVWTADKNEGSPNDESFTFAIEGLKVTIDVGIEFSVIEADAGKVYSEYRKSLGELTDGAVRNYVRDQLNQAIKPYTDMEKFITQNQMANQMADVMKEVESSTKNYFSTRGLEISQVYLIGSPNYPQKIVDAISRKVEATQNAIAKENELRESEAEAQKMKALAQGEADSLLVRARAEAEANNLLQKSLTKEMLTLKYIEKWNGVEPTVKGGSDTGFILNLNK